MQAIYTKPMRWIHWIMAALMISLMIVGLWMAHLLPEDATYRWDVYDLHKGFGVIVGGLIIIRIITRIRSAIPALPASIKPKEVLLSKLGHWGLYLLMIAMPVSGVVMSQSLGYPVSVFGYTLPALIEKNKEIGEISRMLHGYIAYGGIALIAAHIGAVIKHKYIDGESLLQRMKLF